MRYAQAAWSCRSISGRCRCVSHLARLRLSLPHDGLRRMAQGSMTWGPRMPDMGHSCPLTQRYMQNFISFGFKARAGRALLTGDATVSKAIQVDRGRMDRS
jgi:hypothetical protein